MMNDSLILLLIGAVCLWVAVRNIHIHVHQAPRDGDVIERLRKMEQTLDKAGSELKDKVGEMKGQ